MNQDVIERTIPLPEIAPGNPPADISTLMGQGIRLHCLAPQSRRLATPPRFMLGDISEDVLKHYAIFTTLPPVGIFHAENVEIFGESIVSRAGTAYRFPEFNVHAHRIVSELNTLRALGGPRRRRKLPGRYAMLIGPGLHVYGHWLIDFLPRIALLRLAGHDISALRYLLPKGAPRFGLELLDMLGINRNQLVEFDPTEECLSADELLIPTNLHNNVRMSPLLRDVADFFKEAVSARHGLLAHGRTPSRLFLTRKGVNQGRGLLNRARIEAMAAGAGFTVISPETMPLIQQIHLFAGAREIIGEYGSALHNSLFSPQGTIVAGLRGNAVHPGFIQSGIAEALGQPTGYVFGGLSNQDSSNTMRFDYTISENAFFVCLATVFEGHPL